MKNLISILLICLICISAGCAQYYYQEGKTFEQCAKDREDCLSQVKKLMGSTTPGSYEYKFMEECMKSRGYKLVTENKLPLDVKRQDPDMSTLGQLYGRRRGIAGTIDGN
jgi:hypothetical protein